MLGASESDVPKSVKGVGVKMDANDVLRYAIQIPCFLGLFEFKDLLDLNIVKNNVGFIVINNEHAIAVYITDETIDVLDPLGPTNVTTFGPICEFLAIHLPCKRLRMNSKLQSDSSNNCALFCLLFLFMRCHGHSFQDVLNTFNCDLEENDKIVKNMFQSIFTPVNK